LKWAIIRSERLLRNVGQLRSFFAALYLIIDIPYQTAVSMVTNYCSDTHTHAHTHTHTHTHAHTHTHTYAHTRTHAHMHAHTHACTHARTFIWSNTLNCFVSARVHLSSSYMYKASTRPYLYKDSDPSVCIGLSDSVV